MKKHSLLIVLTVLTIIAFISLSVVFGIVDKTDSLSGSYSFAVATGPYDLEMDSVDRSKLHDSLREVIDVPFSVGIAKDYSHGYPDIMILTESSTTFDSDKVIGKLNEVQPELSVSSLDVYSFEEYGNRTINISLMAEILVVAIVFLALCYMFIKQ